jgi:hypothetical protein
MIKVEGRQVGPAACCCTCRALSAMCGVSCLQAGRHRRRRPRPPLGTSHLRPVLQATQGAGVLEGLKGHGGTQRLPPHARGA